MNKYHSSLFFLLKLVIRVHFIIELMRGWVKRILISFLFRIIPMRILRGRYRMRRHRMRNIRRIKKRRRWSHLAIIFHLIFFPISLFSFMAIAFIISHVAHLASVIKLLIMRNVHIWWMMMMIWKRWRIIGLLLIKFRFGLDYRRGMRIWRWHVMLGRPIRKRRRMD